MNDEDDLLASLVDQPGWPILVRLYDEVQERRVRAVTNDLLAGKDPDFRAIDVERGKRLGAEWFLKQPELARIRTKRDRVTVSG